ncbi:MAG: DsrE family protein [Acidobacteria bacterium]|nr:DsrE family protein [Acidobacteriota bacterium]
MGKNLTMLVMDAPYESANSTTALRIVQSALHKGHNVHVFAYEGAVTLTLKSQQPHANPAKGTTAEQEQHPTTKDWIKALFEMSKGNGAKLEWTNCGLCVDERGPAEWIDGPKRGGPPEFARSVIASDTTLVVPTKRNC